LQDFQLRLGDATPGLGGARDQGTAFALEPGAVALERSQAVEGRQVLLPEIAYPLEFLLVPLDLLGLRCLLLRVALDLLAELGDLLLELGLLSLARAANSFRSPVVTR
jgi:hypothetical protein